MGENIVGMEVASEVDEIEGRGEACSKGKQLLFQNGLKREFEEKASRPFGDEFGFSHRVCRRG